MTEYISAKRNYSGLTAMGVNYYIDDAELQNLYQWLDRLPLSRPKKNIAKDFSDGGRYFSKHIYKTFTSSESFIT